MFEKNILNIKNEEQPFHLVNASPWPILVGLFLPLNRLNAVDYFHNNNLIWYNKYIILITILIIIAWFNDIIIEGTYEGHHTQIVQTGLRIGRILFIISEIRFFFCFFWSFFHAALAPSYVLGTLWPPRGISPLNTWNLPFINTLILLSSGIAITYAHLALIVGPIPTVFYPPRNTPIAKEYGRKIDDIIKASVLIFENQFRTKIISGFIVTIVYGLLFTYCQYFEYTHAKFSIADSIFGTTFFSITGLHGRHILIGTIFLVVQFIRFLKYHLRTNHHIGLEAAIWYWHFVDIVWLFVFCSLYWWNA